MNTPTKFLLSISAAALLLYSAGCKKEVENLIDKPAETVYDTVSNLGSNRIIAYRVANTGTDSIYSSVNDLDSTITVYLPYYYPLYFLEANITLPEGTTISPGPDEPVPVFSTSPFKYRVTGSDSKTAEYTVNVVIQQPEFTIDEFSTEENTVFLPTSSVLITGKDMLPNYDVTKIYLVDKDGKRVYSNFSQFTNGDETSYRMEWFCGSDLTANPALSANTDYWIEMESYSITQKMKYPIRIEK